MQVSVFKLNSLLTVLLFMHKTAISGRANIQKIFIFSSSEKGKCCLESKNLAIQKKEYNIKASAEYFYL